MPLTTLTEVQNFLDSPGVAPAPELAPTPMPTLAPPRCDTLINPLRETGYHVHREEGGGVKTLIADNREQVKPATHAKEYEIQALRYLGAMYVIADYSHNSGNLDKINADKAEANKAYVKAYNKATQQSAFSAEITHELAEEFAKILAEKFKIKMSKARQQLTMARDMSIILDPNNTAQIATISKNKDGRLTLEKSSLIKIREPYYNKKVKKVGDTNKWLGNAKKLAGFSDMQADTWLDRLFEDGGVVGELIKYGIPAPPSARWLPLPANAQLIEMTSQQSNSVDDVDDVVATQFVRIGTLTPFSIDDYDLQVKLAKASLKEIILSQIDAVVSRYRNTYGSINPDTPENKINIFINYQTLLSPHYLEAYFYRFHRDNNAVFVDMAKQAMEGITGKIKQEIKEKYPNIEFDFCQTNSAINKLAGYVTVKTYDEDIGHRNKKIEAVVNLLGTINNVSVEDGLGEIGKISKYLSKTSESESPDAPSVAKTSESEPPDVPSVDLCLEEIRTCLNGTNAAVVNEVILRTRSAFYLRMLLDNQPPYQGLPTYQRNLMQASLEFLTVGSQGLTLVGCKSARDRTAVFAAAAKTMQENPSAMHDWKTLNRGIIASLEQGHHFRSMSYHVAVVKVNDVHEYFVKQLNKVTQTAIKGLKIFVKKLDEFKATKKNAPAPAAAPAPAPAAPAPVVSGEIALEELAKQKINSFKEELTQQGSENLACLSLCGMPANNVSAMFKAVRRAEQHATLYTKAVGDIARTSVLAQQQMSFFRHKDTATFYKDTITKLGINPVESLNAIKEAIASTDWHVPGPAFFVGQKPKPRHINEILSRIDVFDKKAGSLDEEAKETAAYATLTEVIRIAGEIALEYENGDKHLTRHPETIAFYRNLSDYFRFKPAPEATA